MNEFEESCKRRQKYFEGKNFFCGFCYPTCDDGVDVEDEDPNAEFYSLKELEKHQRKEHKKEILEDFFEEQRNKL